MFSLALIEVVVSYEKREKSKCFEALRKISLNAQILHQVYLDAISFAETVLR
jgi:hypothetical protein